MRPLFLLFILTSCSYKFPTPYRGALPTSTNPGTVSTSTSLPFNDINSNSFIIYKHYGYLDSKVIGYKLPKDTVNSAFFQNEMQGLVPFGYGKGVLYPGTVWVSVDKLIDEIEITNLHWTEFLYYIKEDNPKIPLLIKCFPVLTSYPDRTTLQIHSSDSIPLSELPMSKLKSIANGGLAL
jgi:hypothetical protein